MRYSKQIIISVALLASACSAHNEIPGSDRDVKQELTLVASFCSNQSRSFIKDDFGTLSWKSGDAIKVFSYNDPEGAEFITSDSGETAVFKGTMAEGTQYLALYPYAENACCDFNSNYLLSSIPATQQAVAGTFDPLTFVGIAVTQNLDNVQFRNLCGGIRFTVSREDITKVVFRGNANEQITGEVKINFNNDFSDDGNLQYTGNGEEEVTLISSSPLLKEQYYYLTIAPQCLGKGFTMEFFNSEGLAESVICKVPVYIRPSIFGTINNADSEDNIRNILEGLDLSENGCANSYIVSEPGYYKFPNKKGNGDEIANAKFATVIWETDNSSDAIHAKTLIDTIAFKKEYIYFHAASAGDGISLREGNALIAIMSELGTVLWTWHIWLCDGFDPSDNCYLTKSGNYIMDRNLGALKREGTLSCGLFYQWGRKEPFPGSVSPGSNITAATVALIASQQSDDITGNSLYATQFPTKFISSGKDWLLTSDNGRWGAKKTVNDPCPAGWKVPSASEFEGIDTGYFPACGFLDYTFTIAQAGTAYIWTCNASDGDTKPVSALSISAGNANILTLDNARGNGCSVRCIADKKD